MNVVTCDRCEAVADADRVEITTFGDAERQYMWGRITCTTPGCVDKHGSALVEPPDEPGQLTREDRKWLRDQRLLAEEFRRTSRLLFEQVGQDG